MPTKAFANGDVFGRVYGSLPARVVALPGWMHTVADFDRVLAGLDAAALDLHGFGGATPEPPEPWGAAEYAAAIAPAVEEAFGAGNAGVVLGHSFGGRVAVHLATARPELVSALVLTGVPLLKRTDRPPARPPRGYQLAKTLRKWGVLSEEKLEQLRQKNRWGSADYLRAQGVMRGVLVKVTNETYEQQVRAITQPVELVWGADDDQAPVGVAQEAAEMLGDKATVTVVNGVGHFTPTDATEELRKAIERWI